MNIEDKLGCHRAVYVQGFPLKYALWFQTQVNRFGLKLHGQDFMGSSKKQEGDQRPSVRTELDEAWPKVLSSVFYSLRTQWVRLPHRPPASLPQCQGCSLEAGWWSVAQANASVQIYWNASSFLSIFWLVICVGRGPCSVPPKLEHILWKGWSHHSHLGRGQSFIVH